MFESSLSRFVNSLSSCWLGLRDACKSLLLEGCKFMLVTLFENIFLFCCVSSECEDEELEYSCEGDDPVILLLSLFSIILCGILCCLWNWSCSVPPSSSVSTMLLLRASPLVIACEWLLAIDGWCSVVVSMCVDLEERMCWECAVECCCCCFMDWLWFRLFISFWLWPSWLFFLVIWEAEHNFISWKLVTCFTPFIAFFGQLLELELVAKEFNPGEWLILYFIFTELSMSCIKTAK